MSNDNLSSMDYQEHLQNNLRALVNNGKIGFQRFQPAYIQTKQNKFLDTKNIRYYHFCIDVPYAGKILNWEVIFDPEDYSQLPDFDFNDYSFLPEPDIDYIADNVPSWDTWDITQPGSVLKILNEFLALYKKSQLETLSNQIKFKQWKNQYEELLEVMEISPDKVEVHIEANNNEFEYDVPNDDLTVVNFLIVLPIDFNQLPEYYQGDGEELINPGEDYVHLNIQLKKLDNPQIKLAMLLSPRVEQLLGRPKLPKFKKDSTLSDYAQIIQVSIEKQIGLICAQHHARNMFILAIVDAFSRGVVEYDATRFYKITFIYEDFEDYDCLVSVKLGDKFPAERPRVHLQSLYCQVGRFCNKPVIYLYDLQKSQEDNIKSLREVLHQEVKMFQNHRHSS